MTTESRIILTPGPVTTSNATKEAMLRDYSPNEPELLALTAELRRYLVTVVNGADAYECIPLQGAGNTANEATLGTLVPRDRKLLIINNGFYGIRLTQIAAGIGVPFVSLDLPITEPVQPDQLDAALAADPAISHVVVCHVDTGTGLLNPLDQLAAVAKARGVRLIVDAIASFGGLPIDAPALDLEAIVLSPNKWLEGMPGIALVVVKKRRPPRGRGAFPLLLPRPASPVAQLDGVGCVAVHTTGAKHRRALQRAPRP